MGSQSQAYLSGLAAGLGFLDRVRQPIVAFDTARVIASRNLEAARLLHEGDVLRERGGVLAAADASSDVAITLALRELRLGEAAPSVPDRRTLRLARASNGARVTALLAAVRSDLTRAQCPVAVLAVFDPQGSRPVDPSRIGSVFDLTPAEAQVAAAIAGGAAPKEVACDLGVAESTVRTHVKHVFDKTGAHRQTDLVRLLLVADEF